MVETITIAGGKIVGVRTSIFTIFNPEKYDAQAIPSAWQEFFAKARGSELANTQTFYGASIPSMAADVPMDYYAGVIVDASTFVPAGFESYDIPAGDYLAVTHTGPITELAASYQKAYMQALGESGKEMRPAPHLEIYNSQLDPMSVDYTMVIGVPVN
jgi:predicted transcriptional regulator YdeE